MPPSSLPFAVRFLIFLAVILVLHLAAGAGLVLLAMFGFSLGQLSVTATIALAILMGVLIGLLIAIAITPGAIAKLAALSLAVLGTATLVSVVAILGLLAAGTIQVGVAIVLIALVGLAALTVEGIWFFFGVHRLPLSLLGLGGLASLPAIPFRLAELPDTILRLYNRSQEIQPAKDALSTIFTVGTGPDAKTATGQTFMFGEGESRSLTDPAQYAMGWTTLDSINTRAAALAPIWASSLTSAAAATEQFWPMLAQFSTPFNIMPITLVTVARAAILRPAFGAAWTPQIEAMFTAGTLHAIDMTIFSSMEAPTTAIPRFTPVTITLLNFDPAAGTLTPILVSVSNGAATQVYASPPLGATTESAWIYALQAAKVSATVWGTWLGHVYCYHIVTAAMVMTMQQTMSRRHPIRQLLDQQDDFLIGFDQFLLVDWAIGPPTSATSSDAFLRLLNTFAAGRSFGADDPSSMIAAQNLPLPGGEPFGNYPVARRQQEIFAAATAYVTAVVGAVYPGPPPAADALVAGDLPLQAWLAASRDPARGNIQGLPAVTTTAALIGVLTSLIYRVTAHGIARMAPVANPALSWVSNFPPCLEDSRLPAPTATLTTEELLAFMPKTGSMGEMITFLFTFAYSPPYIPLIPAAGVNAELVFTGPAKAACNAALSAFRTAMIGIMQRFFNDANDQTLPAQMNFQLTRAQLQQWERNIEL